MFRFARLWATITTTLTAMIAVTALTGCGPPAQPVETGVVATASTPLATPTVPPAPTALALDPPAGYTVYDSPYWLSFVVPEHWVIVPTINGVIAYEGPLAPGMGLATAVASFEVKMYPTTVGDPLREMNRCVMDIEADAPEIALRQEPTALTINDQPAASIFYTSAEVPNGFVTRYVILRGHGRAVDIRMSVAPWGSAQHRVMLDTMLESVVVHPCPRGATIGDAALPDSFTMLTDSTIGMAFGYPEGWITLYQGDVISVHSADAGPTYDASVVVVPVHLGAHWRDAAMDNALAYVLLYLQQEQHELLGMIPVGAPMYAQRDDMEMTRQLLAGLTDETPLLMFMQLMRQHDQFVLAIGHVCDPTLRPLVERTLDTMRGVMMTDADAVE